MISQVTWNVRLRTCNRNELFVCTLRDFHLLSPDKKRFKLRAVNRDLEPMNAANFLKMAHGDLPGLRQLAFDFFNDTRRQMTGWMALIEAGNHSQLRADLHRCKGGASLFGLERIVAIIGSFESQAALEGRGFDITEFESELSAAEKAVIALTD